MSADMAFALSIAWKTQILVLNTAPIPLRFWLPRLLARFCRKDCSVAVWLLLLVELALAVLLDAPCVAFTRFWKSLCSAATGPLLLLLLPLPSAWIRFCRLELTLPYALCTLLAAVEDALPELLEED